MLKNAADTYNRMHPAAKVAILGAGAYLLYKLFVDDDIVEGQSHTSGNTEPNPANLSYPLGTYDMYADEIFVAVWGAGAIASWTEDDELIASILMDMQTLDDVYALLRAYGRRTVGIVLEDGGNLVETVSRYLDDGLKDDVNEDYRAKNIPFQW